MKSATGAPGTPRVGRTRRRFIHESIGGGALIGGTLLAACAGPGGGGDASAGSAPVARSDVTVRVHARTGSEDEAYTKRLAEFTAQNKTGIKAVYEGLGDYNTKLVNLIVSGTVGDTMYLLHTNLAYQQYANAGVLRVVDDLMAKDKYDLAAWFPPAKQGMLFDGKQYGLPVRGQIVWNTLFYNPNAVAGASLPDPEQWTHADLTSNMQKLTRKGAGESIEAYGAMPGSFGDFSSSVGIMRRFGGELVSRDGKQVTVNTPACQAALQWYYDGWHRTRTLLTPLRPAGEGTYAPLGNGQAAMMISAQGGFRADINKALNGAYRLEFRVMPKGPGNRVGGFLALNTNAISKSSAHAPEAWEVLKWLSDKESSYALATQQTGSNTPNFRKDAYCDERLLNDTRFSRQSMDAICKGAELPEPDAVLWNLRYDEFNKLLTTRMNDLRDNKAEPTVGWLSTLRTELQAVLDLPRDTGLGGR
ncbi:MAG: extracellular solute-binding protein [Chloroflexota bacterium]|nr:extracellular solute-binding protein [Chloroflexota bacterium]